MTQEVDRAKCPPDPAKMWLWRVWPVIAMLVICAPMWPLTRMFPQDWENQLWLLSYQACHWVETGLPASVYNYKETAGLGTALFYGTLIYPVGGLLTIFLGANLALRVMIIAALSLQYYSMVRLGRAYGWPVWMRHIIATLMLWAIYPLSNIYWRGAIAEMWAWAFFVSAVCSFIQVLKEPDAPETRYDRLAWGLYFVWSFTTHVLTGFLGAAVLAMLAVMGYFSQVGAKRNAVLRQVICSGLAGAAVQLSWLALMLLFGSNLTVANSSNTTRAFLEMSRISAGAIDWSVLLSPISPKSNIVGLPLQDEVSFQIFLGTRVSVALLILLLIALYLLWFEKLSKTWNRFDILLVISGSIMSGLSFLILAWPQFGAFFAPILGVIQFPYRLTNYVNLGWMMVLAGWLARPVVWNDRVKVLLQIAALAALFLALFTVQSKLTKILLLPAAGDRWASLATADPTGSVPSYYGRSDYSVTRWIVEQQVPETAPYVELVPPRGAMDAPTATVFMPQEGWVRTQAQPFPWAQIAIDGRILPPSEIRYYHEFIKKSRLDDVFFLSAGAHRVDYRFEPPAWWLTLRLSSFIWAGIWTLLVICVGIRGPAPRAHHS